MMNKCIYHSMPMLCALSFFGAKHDFLNEAIIVILISVGIGLLIDRSEKNSKPDSE
jgi:hypothetical protein